MSLWNRIKGQKIGGEIGHFGLTDWWLSTFTEAERDYIEKTYQPMSTGGNPHPLTQGNIVSTSRSAVGLLGSMAGWFKKPEDLSIAKRVLDKAEELARSTSDVLDIHFLYQSMIQTYYRHRAQPEYLESAVAACKKQIALGPTAARAFKREPYFKELPRHVGFEQLAIIREKQGDYADAIRLSQAAKKQGWNGDWDKRIARCRTKSGQS